MDIKTGRSTYSVINDLGIVVNDELKGDCSVLKKGPVNAGEATRNLNRELTDDEILQNLSYCMNLGLGITENCNFRCGYCVYSGSYQGERTHSTQTMPLDTARKAVDLFFRTVSNERRINKRNVLYIGFYGGECLLESDLIKEVIAYAESTARETGLTETFELRFRMTTNGYLLDNDEVVDYLQQKNVLIDMSFDGPELEHDKYRVSVKGEKTWGKLMSNIRRIRERHPAFFESNLNFLVTLHPHHDTAAIDRFFLDRPDLFKKDRVRLNVVNLKGLDPAEARHLKETAGPESALRRRQVRRDLDDQLIRTPRTAGTSFTGACFPGAAKLFVDASGRINICEKMAGDAPNMGDVFNGFDFQRIREIIRSYNREVIAHQCWECPAWFMCNVCFAKAFREGDVSFNCSIKDSYPETLTRYLEEKEKGDYDEKNNDSHRSHRDGDGGGVIDFIDSL